MMILKLANLFLLMLLLPGCGDFRGFGTYPSTEHSYYLEGVKLVEEGVADPSAAHSIAQLAFTISPSARLLLRFEKLTEHVSDIDLSEGKKVEVIITLNSEVTVTPKLCYLHRDWMMLATWNLAHPFGASGSWGRPGGDFTSTSCLEPATIKEELTYDVTKWFTLYPRGRDQNFGWILISDTVIEVVGDQSSESAPRIRFQKF